jgi:Protein of unknown function (DUF3253)
VSGDDDNARAISQAVSQAVSHEIAQEIVRQLSRRAAASSICPSEVARALRSDEAAWRALMPQVRTVAAAMRGAGRLRITRGGIDVPDDALHRGAIRLQRGSGFDA